MAFPVEALFTPQQLQGSAKYALGVRLGNWREDDELEALRMKDFLKAKSEGGLYLLQQQAKRDTQLAPAALSPAAAHVSLGATVALRSACCGGALSVALGQLFTGETDRHQVFADAGAVGATARCALTLGAYAPSAASPDDGTLRYGQKLTLAFSPALGARGYLASSRPALVHLGTQLLAKQDVYMLELAEGAAVPYEAAWMVEPADVGARLGSQGQPVPVDAMVCLVHCATHQRLAATHYQQKTDFGLENAVCAHTFVEHKSVRKMHRERTGLPFSSREHTAENEWSFQFGEI